MKRSRRFFRFCYCAALAFFLGFPGLSMLEHRVAHGTWQRPMNMFGATFSENVPVLTSQNWISGEFQRRFTATFDESFGLRNHYVRFYNQILYSAFRETHMLKGELKIGRGNWLHETTYLKDFYEVGTNLPVADLQTQARRLKRISEAYRMRHKFFLILISPAKASLLPETTPLSYEKYGRRAVRNYDVLTNALAEVRAPFVDAHALMADEKPRHLIFTRGGTHWTELGACLALDEVLRASSNFFDRAIPCVEISNIQTNRSPRLQDRDLASMLNLMIPPMNYEAVSFQKDIRPVDAWRPKLALVGTSFEWNLLRDAFSEKSKVFDSIGFAYYYSTFYAYDDAWEENKTPSDASVWNRRWDAADCIVLEINEATMDGPDYWRRFIGQAEAKLNLAPLE